MSLSEAIFYLVLPIISFLYAAVGHGGASGYLAIMALWGFAPNEMKPTALVLNILVASISFWQYKKTTTINWKMFAYLAIGSIPAAFLGGKISVDTHLYRQILGVLLLIPTIRFFIRFEPKEKVIKQFSPILAVTLGIAIGLLSGLIGIGGGIILSPVLLLLAYANFKETAAISALFIVVNSVAGLAGSWQILDNIHPTYWAFVPLAALGGWFGSYWGSHKMSLSLLQYLLALVLLMASAKLLFT